MTTATQHAAPEDIMALLDGELAAAEARAIEQHMEACAECSAVADQFRETSRALSAWPTPEPSEKLNSVIREKSARLSARKRLKAPAQIRLSRGRWRQRRSRTSWVASSASA